MKYLLLVSLFFFTMCGPNETNRDDEMLEMKKETDAYLLVGTYSKKEGHVDGRGEGLVVMKDLGVEPQQVFAEKSVINPTFMDLSSDGKFVYTANETGPDVGETGSVSAFSISESGELHHLSTQASGSFYPCHIEVSPNDQLAIASNYLGGIAVFPVDSTHALAATSQTIFFEGKGTHSRQDASHPHSATISPDGRFAYVADLGTNKIMMFKIDYDEHALIALAIPFIEMAEGAGPRHMEFHPYKDIVYVVNELNGTVSQLTYNDESGLLRVENSISTLPASFEGANTCADIHLSKSGNFLYVSNRGHNSIAIFSVDENGALSSLGYEPVRGETPRNFMVHENTLWVANQDTDNVVVFDIQEDGQLDFKYEFEIKTPVCLRVAD